MTLRPLIVPIYLFLCILLGGASLGGYLGNMVLQLLAVPIIAASLLVRRRTPTPPPARSLLLLGAATLAVLLLQLVPLPPAIWTALPGRERVAEGYALLGQPLSWLPLTLAPTRALATILWILPAIAILLGILRLGAFRARWIAVTILVAAIVSIGVGAAQVGDEGSPLYFYRVTNIGSAVGFFANANHMGTLMVATIPFAAALLLTKPRGGRGSADRRSGKVLMLGAVLAVLAGGLVINESLAAIGLAVPAVGASLLLAAGSRRRVPPWVAIGGVGALTLASVAVIFLAPFGNNLTDASASSSAESRYTSISTTVAAGVDHLPLGSGLGSFEQVYRTYEEPTQIDRRYMNHAHSDAAELFLELGLPGILLVILFMIWWVRRTIALWSGAGDTLSRAATVASGVILAHSLVDYPLRTAAIAALFAACCALMAEPRERGLRRQKAASDGEGLRHLTA